MNTSQINHLKKRLQRQLEETQGFLEIDKELENTELTDFDRNHPADTATDYTTQITEMAIEDFREDEVEEIKAALQAIEDGTYGQCQVCGEEIPYERLEALPTALTCIEHADEETTQ